jgi:hypothetical protein
VQIKKLATPQSGKLKKIKKKDLLNRPDLSGFPEYEKIEKEGFFCSKGKRWGWLVVAPLLFTK